MAKVTKIENIDDLRELLSQTLINLTEEKISPEQAMAASKISGKILESARLQLEYAKSVGVEPVIKFVGIEKSPTPLQNGINKRLGKA